MEAANLRHMPEVLWFLFWTSLHAPAMVDFCTAALTPDDPQALCHGQWQLRCRVACAEAIDSARRGVGLRVGGDLTLMPPAAASSTKPADYQAAAAALGAEMRAHLQHHVPEGVVQQLARELRRHHAHQGDGGDEPRGDAPVGLPLHLASAAQLRGLLPPAASEDASSSPPLAPRPSADGGSGDAGRLQRHLRAGSAASERDSASGLTTPMSASTPSFYAAGGGGGAAAARDEEAQQAEQLVLWQLQDLAVHGDGGWVVDRLVQPIFTLLAHEVRRLCSTGGVGREVAAAAATTTAQWRGLAALPRCGVQMDALAAEDPCHRLGYDDVNESMCHAPTVHACLAKLGVSSQVRLDDDGHRRHTAARLRWTLCAPPPTRTASPRCSRRARRTPPSAP